jgi:hypothetical protein
MRPRLDRRLAEQPQIVPKRRKVQKLVGLTFGRGEVEGVIDVDDSERRKVAVVALVSTGRQIGAGH